jgi:hypothetical protein
MSSDISATIELDLKKDHNLIIQPIFSDTGQQIQFSGTLPIQTLPGNLIKLQLSGNKGIINVVASSNEANVEMIRTPFAENIFNSIIEVVRSSADADNESMAILLEIIRDNYTSGADNQDLVEKLKQISHDEERFEIIWTKTSPFILEALKKLLQQALN